MDELNYLRHEIDNIDKEIVNLFEKRMHKVLKVGDYKKKNNIPILSQNREDEVISNNIAYLKDKSLEKPTEKLLNSIMSISREIQKKQIMDDSNVCNKKDIVVGFQGVEGSFSQQALLDHFGEGIKTKSISDFESVFKSLNDGEIDYAVLPIENSSTGAINEIYDLLRNYGFYIVGEQCIKVEHNLLVNKGVNVDEIEEVYSHQQAFNQSSEFLKMHPTWKLIPYKNTAISAELIKNEKSHKKAAIASKRAGEIYDLDILESNINFNQNNFTRFIIIGRQLEVDSDSNKISIVLSLCHKPGMLFNILKHFEKNNLNMLKIESRPIIDKPWEYFFYIDFEGCLNDKIIKETIDTINKNSLYFKLLGNYRA